MIPEAIDCQLGYRDIFLDIEGNIPRYFSTVILKVQKFNDKYFIDIYKIRY